MNRISIKRRMTFAFAILEDIARNLVTASDYLLFLSRLTESRAGFFLCDQSFEGQRRTKIEREPPYFYCQLSSLFGKK